MLISDDAVAMLAARLEISTEMMRKIAQQAGARCESP
jgi:hypothetical protein